ncbi:MAG: hypothetical protein JW837_12270 [Sedimentisphaerales bacterium]|nr:hypothetical protein [Sedimentisphaerales bacterium]
MNSVEWLNENAGFIMAILTCVYVIATILILCESRRNNLLQSDAIKQSMAFERARNRPYVVFEIQSELRTHSEHDSDVYYSASAKNMGLSSAHNISIKTSPELNARLGWGANKKKTYRIPSILRKPISVLLPGEEIKEIVGPAMFLFEDKSDDELSFEVSMTYSDIAQEIYQEKFTINLAWQKEHVYYEDREGKNKYRLLRDVKNAVHALEKLGRILDSPDRSNLFTPMDPSTIDSTQIDLLRRLIDVCDNTPDSVTFIVIDYVTGPEIHKMGSKKTEKIEGSVENVQYLCRVGALSGYYKDGILYFSVSPTAKVILQSRQNGEQQKN